MTTRFRSIVAGVLEVPADELNDDTGPRTLGQWTSLKHIQLIAAIEDAYGIRFAPAEIRSAKNLATIRDHLQKRGIAV